MSPQFLPQPSRRAHRAGIAVSLLTTLGILAGCSEPITSDPEPGPDNESATSSEQAESPSTGVDIPTGLDARSFAEGIDDAELLSWVEAAIGEMKDPPT
ncbi:MAG: hypothetical protein VW008_03540, partial [Aquiluna sp.]